jgi:glycosyltransferase involved in cell wall biosynthesis
LKASVIVSIYNGANILNKTIFRLFCQSISKNDYEVILVNDGSIDESKKIIQKFKNEINCIIINHGKNLGRCATKNSGIKIAKGEILIFLDCDIEVKDNFVQGHIEKHKIKDVVGVVSGIEYNSIEIKDKYQQYLNSSIRGSSNKIDFNNIHYKYFIMACTSIKHAIIMEVGLLSEELTSYGIDLDYAYRISKKYGKNLYQDNGNSINFKNLKSLNEILIDIQSFANGNLPKILSKHPELNKLLKIKYVKYFNGQIFYYFIGYLLINKITFSFIHMIIKVIPYPLSNYCIRYILGIQLLLSYRIFLKKTPSFDSV